MQWERLDGEGLKIINDLLMIDAERVEWPENTEPKFTRKKAAKITKVAYNTKTKRYTYYDKSVTAGEPIRLDIPDSFIYFNYCPVKKEYIVINTPNRFEPDAKYIVTASYCHWIRERNIILLTLLMYAT